MPESKSRHPHHHQHPQHKTSNTHAKSKKASRVVIFVALFFAFLGFSISYFIDDTNITRAIAAAVVGGIAGYLFGHQVDKSLAKK
jgi:hypothetical protein